MKLSADKKFLIFQISWLIILIGTICDFSIAGNVLLGPLNLNIQLSTVAVVIYLLIFVFLKPGDFFKILTGDKFNRNNIFILFLLGVIIYLSCFFSLMQKFALITTTSRYTLYFLAFLVTIYYTRTIEKAGTFLLTAFIYSNCLIAAASIADYLIPSFNNILVEYFGHMEEKHFYMVVGNVKYMRPSGFITDTNLTAFSLGLAAYLLLLNRKVFNKYFVYVFFLLSGFVSGMLASRSAVITVIFLVLYALIIKQIQWKTVLVFILLFFSVQFLTPQSQGRLIFFYDKNKKYEELQYGRPLVWKACFVAMKLKPSVGIGTGVFFKQSEILMKKVKNEISDEIFTAELSNPAHAADIGINPHNIFFSMFIEHGIGGLLLFTVLVLYNFIYLYKNRKLNSLSIFISIIFVSSLSNYAPYYKYYLLMCVIYYVSIKTDQKLFKSLAAE